MDFPELPDRGRTPKYRQIADAVVAAIQSGELRAGDVLPSEKQIQDSTGTGRNTARQAIAWLREQGWVETEPGRGSYVASRPPIPAQGT